MPVVMAPTGVLQDVHHLEPSQGALAHAHQHRTPLRVRRVQEGLHVARRPVAAHGRPQRRRLECAPRAEQRR